MYSVCNTPPCDRPSGRTPASSVATPPGKNTLPWREPSGQNSSSPAGPLRGKTHHSRKVPMQPSQLQQHRPALFPTVRASNLNRRTFNLPADFESERNLVIVAFQRHQQEVVDTWTAPIRDLLARYPDLRFYELPTISHHNPLFRAWLDGAMRGGVP